MLDRAPVAAEQRVGADEIDGAGDPAAVALGHHQQHVLGHGLADQRKERAGEIRPAPFARAGLHVEFEERVPRILGDVAAGQRVDGDAVRQRVAPLALDRLAMARIERGEEIVERCRSPDCASGTAGRCAAGSRARQGMFHSASRAKVTWTEEASVASHSADQPAGQRGRRCVRVDAVADQQPRSGGRRERNRGLQFRIIAGRRRAHRHRPSRDRRRIRPASAISDSTARCRRSRRRAVASRWRGPQPVRAQADPDASQPRKMRGKRRGYSGLWRWRRNGLRCR